MNEVETNEDGTILEFVQLPVPFTQDDDWTKDKVSALLREDSGEVPEDSCTLLLCFVAIKEDMETLELLLPFSPVEQASNLLLGHDWRYRWGRWCCGWPMWRGPSTRMALDLQSLMFCWYSYGAGEYAFGSTTMLPYAYEGDR